jgi:hypothetical protein
MVAVGAAILAVGSPAGASEETIHPWKKVSVTVNGGRGFGTVQVKLTVTPKSGLRSIAVSIGGRKVSIPARAAKGLPKVQLSSLAIHTEPGYGPKPWLYVVLRVLRSNLPAGVKQQWVYFKFQGGRFKGRSIKSKTRNNQYKFVAKPI